MERKLLNNHQYHVAPTSSEKVDELVKLLKERGYSIGNGLDNVLSLGKLPVGLCIDNGLDNRNNGKCIFTTNVTCMACYCTWSQRKPLYDYEIIQYINKLIDELDIVFYNDLLDTVVKEKDRTVGAIYTIK